MVIRREDVGPDPALGLILPNDEYLFASPKNRKQCKREHENDKKLLGHTIQTHQLITPKRENPQLHPPQDEESTPPRREVSHFTPPLQEQSTSIFENNPHQLRRGN